jgi:predicted  nucleic acid-binding Zn-ribbon protein
MPHQCTTCDRVFADGSKEMLSGCPDCGGNKFQFQPATADSSSASESGSRSNAPTASDERTHSVSGDGDDSPEPTSSAPTDSTGRDDVRSRPRDEPAEPMTGSSPASSSTSTPPSSSETATPTETGTDAEVERGDDGADQPSGEDFAQASARTDMVSPDELADAAAASRTPPDDVDGRVIEPKGEDRPGLDELREELNSQFESIKIVSPGQYELNLMELYDRREYIISLQEDGRYVIEVSDSWGNSPGDE